MRHIRLTKQERTIEDGIEEFAPLKGQMYQDITQALVARKKDAVLNMRVNRHDLESIKQKARRLGVKYQTFISEILHRVAQA